MRLGGRPHHRHPRRNRGDPVSSEDDERLAAQGPRGAQGNQGNRGEQGTAGLSSPVRRAVVFMFALAVLLAAFGLFWINHAVHDSQAAQQRAGAVLEQKLCTTFGKLAALKPPAGDPATNPSRAFDDNLHATLDELGTDLGCR
jgi:hypothetical protein